MPCKPEKTRINKHNVLTLRNNSAKAYPYVSLLVICTCLDTSSLYALDCSNIDVLRITVLHNRMCFIIINHIGQVKMINLITMCSILLMGHRFMKEWRIKFRAEKIQETIEKVKIK